MSEQRHIQEGAKEIAQLLDNRKTHEVENRLLSDMLNMTPGDFKKLIETVNQQETKNVGADLELTFSGKQMRVGIADIKASKSEILADGFNGGTGQWRFNKGQVYDRVFGQGVENDLTSAIEQNPQNLAPYLTRQGIREAVSKLTHEQLMTPEGKKTIQEAARAAMLNAYGTGININNVEVEVKAKK